MSQMKQRTKFPFLTRSTLLHLQPQILQSDLHYAQKKKKKIEEFFIVVVPNQELSFSYCTMSSTSAESTHYDKHCYAPSCQSETLEGKALSKNCYYNIIIMRSPFFLL